MADTGETGSAGPERRGEAGWKAHLQRIAARNDEARKAGIKQRQEQERHAETVRLAQERRVDAELNRKFELRP